MQRSLVRQRSSRGVRNRRPRPAPAVAALLGLALSLAPLAVRADEGIGAEPSAPPPAPTRSESSLDIVADELEYVGGKDVYLARGNVRITQGDRTLTADRVLFNNTTKIGVASGDVVVTEGADTLRAKFIQFDTETLLGVVFEGKLRSEESSYVMSGTEVRKTGAQTYVFTDGTFTTCRCPEPESRQPWELNADKADLELDGYGTARNATVEILGVPIFWLPWAKYPLRKDRQTGFLFPEFGISDRSGYEFGIPFFWESSRQTGVLFTPRYFTKRGFKPELAFDYVFGERGRGELYGSYIHDMGLEDNDQEGIDPKNRWGVSVRHFQDLPGDFGLRVDVPVVSDNDYPFDFRDFSQYQRDAYMQTRSFVSGPFGPDRDFVVSAAIQTANDLQNPNNQDRDDILLQRLPDIRVEALDGRIPGLGGVAASLALRYTYFRPWKDQEDEIPGAWEQGRLFYDTGADAVRNGQEINAARQTSPLLPQPEPGLAVPASVVDINRDDFLTEGNARFEEGEPLADRGSRLIARPTFSYPTRLGDLVELYPEIGYYGTYYATDLNEARARNMVTGRIELRSQLRGTHGLPLSDRRATHILEPRLGWVFVSNAGQSSNPLLVPKTAVPQQRLRLMDLDNRIDDPADRIDYVNSIVFGVVNRWLGDERGDLLGELSLLADYSLADRQWGAVVLEGTAANVLSTFTRFWLVFDPVDYEIDDGLFQVAWNHSFGHRVGIRYRFIRDIPRVFEAFQFDNRFKDFEQGFQAVNQLSVQLRAQLTKSWAITYGGAYSFEGDFSLVNTGGVEYVSRCRCWAARFQVSDDRTRGFQFDFQWTLIGLGQDEQFPFGGPRGFRTFVDSL